MFCMLAGRPTFKISIPMNLQFRAVALQAYFNVVWWKSIPQSYQIPYVLQFVRISIVANVLSVRYSNRRLHVTLHARCSYICKACPPQQNKIARRSLLSYDHRQVRFWFKLSSYWMSIVFPASRMQMQLSVSGQIPYVLQFIANRILIAANVLSVR